ncbi:MAG: response regulator [Desulfarculaceae bacterium]|nr:response regulator [Desulfarculaceae bacterium]
MKSLSILIVNHEAETRAFLKTFLVNQGFHVSVARQEKMLESTIEKIKPDVLIIDQPLCDIDLLDRLARYRETAMIFISSIPPESLAHYRRIQQFQKQTNFAFLEKPLQEDELLHSIRMLTETTSEKTRKKEQ